MKAPTVVPTAPMIHTINIRPVSFQMRLRLHCSSNRGMPIGTMTPQTISSYSTLLVGMMPTLARIMAMIRAMMAPEILEAHLYFCSRKIEKATARHMTPRRPQVLSAAISDSRPSRFIKTEFNKTNALLSKIIFALLSYRSFPQKLSNI